MMPMKFTTLFPSIATHSVGQQNKPCRLQKSNIVTTHYWKLRTLETSMSWRVTFSIRTVARELHTWDDDMATSLSTIRGSLPIIDRNTLFVAIGNTNGVQNSKPLRRVQNTKKGGDRDQNWAESNWGFLKTTGHVRYKEKLNGWDTKTERRFQQRSLSQEDWKESTIQEERSLRQNSSSFIRDFLSGKGYASQRR